jgi:hypothetical protein
MWITWNSDHTYRYSPTLTHTHTPFSPTKMFPCYEQTVLSSSELHTKTLGYCLVRWNWPPTTELRNWITFQRWCSLIVLDSLGSLSWELDFHVNILNGVVCWKGHVCYIGSFHIADWILYFSPPKWIFRGTSHYGCWSSGISLMLEKWNDS